MKKIFMLIPVIIMLMVGCELLDHDPFNDQKIEEMFDEFSAAFSTISADDVSDVMVFYDQDYFHDLQDVYGREEFYLSLFQSYGEDITFECYLTDYKENLEIEWVLGVNYEVDGIQMVENFEFVEYLKDNNGEYYFYGNQVNPPALDPDKPIVFVEYGTAENCGNCPPASSELHHMQLEHGAQFIYVTYCAGEPMSTYIDFATYYNETAQPVTIFGGQYKIVGASEDDLAEFDQRYNQVLSGTPEAFLSNITWSDDGEMIDGTVDVDLQGVSTANLVLMAALVDERPELYYDNGGNRIYNVLFAVGEEQVGGSGTAEFRIEYDLPSYSDTMPATTKLIVWLQTKDANYNPDTCKIHTAAEIDLF